MNQACGGEPSELLAMEGYQITVGAKPLHVVDETFCSILIDRAKCRYLVCLIFEASAERHEPAKIKGIWQWCAGRLFDA